MLGLKRKRKSIYKTSLSGNKFNTFSDYENQTVWDRTVAVLKKRNMDVTDDPDLTLFIIKEERRKFHEEQEREA